MGHVEGGAAAEGAVGGTDLEDLSQSRLEEGGGHADAGDHPHPEDGAGTAHEQSSGDAEDVADPHAGGQRDGEGLEGGDTAPGPASRTADLPDHIGQVAHLDTAGDDGEERAGSDEDPHGDVSRDPVGGGLEGIREGVH